MVASGNSAPGAPAASRPSACLGMHSVAGAAAVFSLVSVFSGAGAQGNNQHGGHPPAHVETELCQISDVFSKLTEIQNDADCRAGCAGGSGDCGQGDWLPGATDWCSANCGIVFEPFWDQCGDMVRRMSCPAKTG